MSSSRYGATLPGGEHYEESDSEVGFADDAEFKTSSLAPSSSTAASASTYLYRVVGVAALLVSLAFLVAVQSGEIDLASIKLDYVSSATTAAAATTATTTSSSTTSTTTTTSASSSSISSSNANDPFGKGGLGSDLTDGIEPVDGGEVVSSLDLDTISFKMNRVGYSPISLGDDVLYYSFLKNYDVVLEPYAPMALVVVDYTDSTIYYDFEVCKKEDTSKQDCSTGTLSLDKDVAMNVDVTLKCDPFDEFVLTVYEMDSQGNEIRSTPGAGVCMYVRREIRQLSTDDLSTVMDAMYVMYSTSLADGTELYGDNYKPSGYLLGFHHFNSAWQEADHIHEGNGFLPQHMKMTNIVETSLQSIDPSIALPYWDFTIDQSDGKSSVSSFVMTPTVFGSMSQPADLSWGFTYASDSIIGGAIPDGRWAYLTTDTNDKYEDLYAGYGYMRAPWNMNPSPYISRFTMDLQIGTSLPSCQEHYNMLEYDTLMDYLYDIQYGPHATTHSLTGGIYGCDLMKPLLDAGYATDETNLKMICASWLFYIKEFYRYNYITPWDDCVVDSEDVGSASCGFDCTTDTADSTAFLFNLKNKLAANVPSDMSDEGWTAWKDFICTGDGGKIFSGDHLESASPADPSFWVIHPTLERLTHAKLMAGGFQDDDWAEDVQGDQKVCDKSQCYDEDKGGMGYWDNCCYGHFEDSKFLDFTTGNKSNYYGETNGAIMLQADPRAEFYSMPYIYDSFSWKHCSQDFDGLLTTLAAEGNSTRRLERIEKRRQLYSSRREER